MNPHAGIGEELFRFETFVQWANKASTWCSGCGVPMQHLRMFDARDRVCRIGAHFMRARDEGTFPVRVIRIA